MLGLYGARAKSVPPMARGGLAQRLPWEYILIGIMVAASLVLFVTQATPWPGRLLIWLASHAP